MSKNVNCHYCNEYYQCLNPKRKRIWGFITRECIELNLGKRCLLAIRRPRPIIRPTSPPPKTF